MSGGRGNDGVVRFPVSSLTSLVIQKGDITQWYVDGKSDAIVNPANERMLGGGGVDGAIHSAAGPDLVQACYAVPEVRPGVRCPTGEARITLGSRLPASRVIHTVGPIYSVDKNPAASLRNAYRNCLDVAKRNNVQYIAFTAISCGVYGYPHDEAATIAISAVREFANGLKEVHFVLFPSDTYNVWLNKASKMSGGQENDGVVRFPVPLTSLVIQKGDITQWFVDGKSDAIVNPANERMLGGGGADGAIHSAAGPNLVRACSVPEVRPGVRCPTGEARITFGFRLPASRVIHTVGPIYYVDRNPAASLRNAYRNCLDVAKRNHVQYIAFTAISCGSRGYPHDEAATIAISAVREFANGLKEVHFVLFSSDIYNVWLNKAAELLN